MICPDMHLIRALALKAPRRDGCGRQKYPSALRDWVGFFKSGHYCIPSADLYMSMIASSSAISSGLRLRKAITRRMTLVS